MSISCAPFINEFSESKNNLESYNKDYIFSLHTRTKFPHKKKDINCIDTYLFQWLKNEYNFITKAKLY